MISSQNMMVASPLNLMVILLSIITLFARGDDIITESVLRIAFIDGVPETGFDEELLL